MLKSSVATKVTITDTAPGVSFRWTVLAWITIWLQGAYLVIVLPIDERVWPGLDQPAQAVLTILLSLVASYQLIKHLHFRRPQILSESHLKDCVACCCSVLFCCLAIDVGYTMYSNLAAGPQLTADPVYGRGSDWQLWDAELYPRSYYPTKTNIHLWKPDFTMSGFSYGSFYSPEMLRSPLLSNAVLSLQRVTFAIDKYGFRETHRPEDASIFALGDSFCFGQHIEQDSGWVEVLHSRLNKPVYNLGITATSPRQQHLLLEYVLKKYPDTFKPKHVLWMIFEGNDLEDDYSIFHAQMLPGRLTTALGGTLVELVASIPHQLRRQSVIRRVTGPRVTFSGSIKNKQDPYQVDGLKLKNPLYRSRRFGYRLFDPTYTERATMPESYVLNHPNRPGLDQTFRDMRTLSQQHGFSVTVLIAPSDVRLYAEAFDGFPQISKVPHFIRYVNQLSDSLGFETIDLNELLKPIAARELLYQRDDTHWNTRGNSVVAALIASHVFHQGSVD